MIKKIVKVLLVLLMVTGAAIAAYNVVNAELQAGSVRGQWRNYLKDVPDCKGDGDTCFDFTLSNE